VSGAEELGGFDTLLLEIDDHVACVTLNRPEMHNAFNERMQEELGSVWQILRTTELVRAVVLTGSGEKAFCTGVDRSDIPFDTEFDPYTYDDPGPRIGPKARGLWKPVIAAVNGIACGGAFYLLGESDIVLAADHATFFDPHVTYGMTASFEPMLLLDRMAFGDLVRMTLVGVHERMSAQTAREVGLVSEVVPAAELLGAARRLAGIIASQPPASIQASLRTLWAARGLSPEKASSLGNIFLELGTSSEALKQGQEIFAQSRVDWRLR
jgi:enoyl-CoA hydratase/carnithine racemase